MIWEHLGDNRSGKTFLNALMAWEAYNLGRKVYCSCSTEQGFPCILNFPHYHIDLEQLRHVHLFNSYLMTDESVEFMDARRANTNLVREIGLFGYQATKRGVDWHYDAVRHKNIDPRIRLNPHYIVESFRIPRDPRLTLKAIRFEVNYRYGGTKQFYVTNPKAYFPIYNHEASVQGDDS